MASRAAPRLPIVRFIEERSLTQRVGLVGIAAVYVIWQSVRTAAATGLDRWWLDSVTDAPVWSRRTAAELQLGVATGAFVAFVLGGSVYLVLRVARADHRPRHRVWQRYEERFGPAHAWVLVGLAAYLTWHIGRAAAGEWQSWLLFRHGADLGVEVPEVGRDVGFYLFRLPLLLTASSFVRQFLVLTLAVSAFGHFASGALRLPRGGRSSAPSAVVHLSLLLAAVLGAQAWHDVVVARAATATNRIGAFDGPGFTEMNVTRPALLVAGVVALAAGFAVVNGARTGRWRIPTAMVGAAVAVHLIGVVVAPIAVERLVVAPAEAERQLWSIEHNLDATRAAYGLDGTDRVELDLHEGLAPDEIAALATGSQGNIPLFSTDQLAVALQVQAGTPGTRITDVDLEPYVIGTETRPVFVAPRSASRNDLPERGWVQQHLVYTHGDGVVAFAADVVDDDGRPDITSLPELDDASHAPLYFGEGLDRWYAIVDTKRAEAGNTHYEGEGVPIGSLGRRLVLSLAIGDAEPVLSNELGPDARLLYRRGIRERIAAIAPFLTLDSDPYAVVVDDRVVWIVDAYSTASTYPYAQFLPVGVPGGTAVAGREQNYVRGSVKITIDAGDGTVRFYRTDDGDDPIIEAWAEIFPELFDDIDELPSSVADHVRAPNDLFAVQTVMLGRYQVDDAEELFNGSRRWTISPAVATTVGGESSGPARAVDAFVHGPFSLTRTYSPGAADNPASTRDELAALAIADHGSIGGLSVIQPTGDVVLSPAVAQSAIDADPDLARQITLLNANGSHVEFGPMTPILVGDGIAWARPITVVGTGAASIPRLYGVAVVSDGLVGIGPSVVDAVAALGQSSAE